MLYGFAGDLPMAFGILSFAASEELCNNLKYIMIFILFATSFEVRRGMHWASESKRKLVSTSSCQDTF
jgi:hypothetical protein